MFIKFFTSALLVFFLAACSTTPKDTADSSGSGSSSSSSDVSSSEEGTITETSPESASITPGSQEDLIVNVGDRVFFAGEATSINFATVHGADLSGKRVANDVIAIAGI